MLIQVFLDPLGFAQEERRMGVGTLDEFLQDLHRVLEFLRELGVFLVLPGIAQRGKARLQERHAVLRFGVEAFEFLREAPDLARIHDGLWHVRSSRLVLSRGKIPEAAASFQWEFRLQLKFRRHFRIEIPCENY